jgi:predicted ATP-dependent endonuclease of OLD family
MFIKKLKTKNFKVIGGENEVFFGIPDGETKGSGLNIFVGENNSGKSSLMEAAYFLRNKAKKNLKTLGLEDEDESFTEITFTGGNINDVIDNFVQENKREVFKNFIYENNDQKYLTLRRLTKDNDSAKITYFYKEDTDEYKKNPGGLDASIQSFFQISNVWADSNPESEAKYGASTICGNLLSDISEKFKIDHRHQYEKFLTEFHKTFNDPASGLQSDLNIVAKETEEILAEQFGEAKLDFKFDNPEPDILFKNIKIFIDDGENTEISEKGHGLQRAVILSLLQVYAKRITEEYDEDGGIKLKPHFLFIDEPELGLHPQAQKKLFLALMQLSKTHQIFISTHSENFISVNNIQNIYKFNKVDSGSVDIVNLDSSDDIILSENRKFFLHHHKLFFTKKAIFLEGVSDYERYPLFLSETHNSDLIKDLCFMGGCNHYSMFNNFCDLFNIKKCFIFDLDVIAKNSRMKDSFPDAIKNKILILDVDTPRKDPSNLFDINLTEDKRDLKHEIINDLRQIDIYVLKEGAIEQYLDNSGETSLPEKKLELNSIFDEIKGTFI